MSKIEIEGRWIEIETCESWKEERDWDGRNHISRATGSQWEHEKLFRTAKGAWVLHSWSQWQGSLDSYRFISEEEAHAWLLRNEHFDAVPQSALAELEA